MADHSKSERHSKNEPNRPFEIRTCSEFEPLLYLLFRSPLYLQNLKLDQDCNNHGDHRNTDQDHWNPAPYFRLPNFANFFLHSLPNFLVSFCAKISVPDRRNRTMTGNFSSWLKINKKSLLGSGRIQILDILGCLEFR